MSILSCAEKEYVRESGFSNIREANDDEHGHTYDALCALVGREYAPHLWIGDHSKAVVVSINDHVVISKPLLNVLDPSERVAYLAGIIEKHLQDGLDGT